MKTTAIYTAFKKALTENYDAEHYLSILFSNPENEWFTPNNRENEVYTICEQMAAAHLIAVIKIPVWVDGSFRGLRTEFLYNKDLNY